MTALVDLQRQMVRAIRDGSGESSVSGFRSEHLPEGEALSIYRNHHRISLCAALAMTFQTVSLLIGEQAFSVLAWRFLLARPPMQPCVSEYGAEFSCFLEMEPLVKDLPYLADVARLDWAINVARGASDTPSLDAEAMSAMAPDQMAELRVEPHPSMTLLHSRYPLLDIFRLARAGEEGEPLSLDAGGGWLMIARRDGLMINPIASDVVGAFEKMKNGDSMSSVCEELDEAALSKFVAEYLLSGAFIERQIDRCIKAPLAPNP